MRRDRRLPREAPRHQGWRVRWGPWVAVACVVVLLPAGCNRTRYRLQADRDAYATIQEKANDPRWSPPRITIDVDPRSRMFDPNSLERPPMPPDDPVAHEYMHWVDGKRGFPYWHRNGSTPFVQNPVWSQFLPTDENGVLTLDSGLALRVALVNSPSYQQQLETLYLSALDVSAERFRYDVQFFGGYAADYAVLGPGTAAGGGRPLSRFELGTRDWRMTRFFTTGAELTVGLANQLVWQFSGPDDYSGLTLLDFSLVQPLLRRAGRDRVLETLTLAERTLLGNVRQLERYRQGFYLDLLTGVGEQSSLTRRGGFFGASGLGGFTGIGGGGFGGVGSSAFGGGIGAGGAGAGTAGGFLGLLQSQQIIRNQEANVAALQNSLAQFEEFYDAGRIDFFQVEQVRQQVFQNISQLLTLRRAYQDALDLFKRDLGLPPQLPVQISDPMLDSFKLIDTAIIPVQERITELQREIGEQIIALLPNGAEPVWSDELASGLERLAAGLDRLEAERAELLRTNVPKIAADVDRLRRSLLARREAAERLRWAANQARQRRALPGEERLIADVDAALLDTRELGQLPEQLALELGDVASGLAEQSSAGRSIQQALEGLRERGPALEAAALFTELREKVFYPLQATVTRLSNDVLRLTLVQARARAESVTLTPVEIEATDALEIARAARLDWMNARASLVDAWRLVQFNADSLESVLDVVFDGEVRSSADDPFRLSSRNGRLRAGLRFDAPLTRLQERNTFRQSLIEYQQARRGYYRFEDGIATTLRAILRQIDLNKANFELRRTALKVAVAQVQSARLELERPPRQAETGGATGTLGPTTAFNLLTALNSLRGAQDDFLSVWVNYEVQRALLDLTMGTLRLDEDGRWLDPGPIGPDFNYPDLQVISGYPTPWASGPTPPENIPPGPTGQ